ncbi:thiol reductant ABC exporter subunit CydC [Oceanobacillus piezotolerans]|uniref:Thiol reductant ABC exporter subunit CydC n=1 Tax=Oceanobacillus piezotolerans TaxID=2448030 RepID=A0A498DGK1_9BACI|nr:thiol reductant ABC exporter subunit CydC [Oceanobacillus piezotolerans]RLL47071.1 thiol reductant ABC exporter subunit CydC [Oceanobacillus piezotolerans]
MRDISVIIKVLLMEKKDIYLSVLFGVIAGLTAVGLFSSSGYLISKAALAPPIYTLMILVSIVKLLGIISALSRYGERFFSHRATFTMLSNLRVSFYEKLEPLAPRLFHRFRSGDLLARIVGDVETLQNFFLRVFYPPIVLALVFFCTILFTSVFSVPVALILLIGFFLTTIVVPVLFAIGQRKVKSSVRKQRGDLSTKLTEFLYGFRDLKIYQQLQVKENVIDQSSLAYSREQERNGIHQLFSESMNTFLSLVVSWVVLGVAAYLVTTGQLNGIFLALLVMISLTVFENTSPMAAFASHFEDSRQAAERLGAVVSEKSFDKKIQKIEQNYDKAPSITMENVTFGFPGESRAALKDFSAVFPSGSKTAIVGPSGSGKSTAMQLFLNIYSPDAGSININGQPIEQITNESIWKHTNVVLQENHFFYGTIKDNLLLAKDNLTDQEMELALENVKLGHFSLDDEVLEKGENLSGGEKQRLAIARAMLKNAPIWILDEPTSSMDALTESHIYQRIFQQAKDDTLILISHKLTGLEKMDQIMVMENGKLIEKGTFDELMKEQGYFYKMKQIEKSVFLAGNGS